MKKSGDEIENEFQFQLAILTVSYSESPALPAFVEKGSANSAKNRLSGNSGGA